MYFAYYNNIPIEEIIINLYTIDPLDKWLGNSNNDQWISQPFSAAVNSPVPAVNVAGKMGQIVQTVVPCAILACSILCGALH